MLPVITTAVAVTYLALVFVAARRRSDRPLAVPLGLVCATMALYTLFDALGSWTGAPLFDAIAYVMAAILAIPTFELVLAFVGMRRRLRFARLVVALHFGGLALATALAIALGHPSFAGSHLWALAMLLGLLPAFGAAAVMLVRHARASGADERARAQLLGGALLLGVGGSVADLAFIASGSPWRLAALPQLVSALLITGLVIRGRVFEKVTSLTLLNAAVVAALAVMAQVALAWWAGPRTGLLVVGSFAVALALVLALRPIWNAAILERQRREDLATIGRFAEQMAHDLKNPLAAISGAAEFLEQERREGRSVDDHADMLAIILERTQRVATVIDDYRRLARVEPRPIETDLIGLARTVVYAQKLAAPSGVRLDLESSNGSLALRVDPDLVAAALENLLQNAFEAEGAQQIRVAIALRDGWVDLTTEDDGAGMDARTRERVFDAFFTTKVTGSGLGLAFVRRVAEAHGGHARLDTREGEGTRVTLSFPH